MRSLLRDSAAIAAQIAVLWLINLIAHWLVDTLELSLPGNVAAVLLTFALLQTGSLPLPSVERGATLLLRHLGLFFVPIAVGLMNFASLWISSGLSILATLLISAAVGFAVTGCFCQAFASFSRGASVTAPLPSHGSDLDPP